MTWETKIYCTNHYWVIIDLETLMDEDDFEIDTGSRSGLQGVEQEDPALRDERKMKAQEGPGSLG